MYAIRLYGLILPLAPDSLAPLTRRLSLADGVAINWVIGHILTNYKHTAKYVRYITD